MLDPLGGGFKVYRQTISDGQVYSGGERSEVFRQGELVPLAGGRVQYSIEVMLPTGFTTTSSPWNLLHDWHYSGSWDSQSPVQVDCRNSGELWMRLEGGGTYNANTNPVGTTRSDTKLSAALPNGKLALNVYHTILFDWLAHPTAGSMTVWLDGIRVADVLQPTIMTGTPSGGNGFFLKRGHYRSIATSGSSTYYFKDTIIWKNSSPDEMLAFYAFTPPDPPVGGSETPLANTRTRRIGVSVAGSGRNGFKNDNKSGSKFATGLTGTEEGDVYDLHVYAVGDEVPPSASTQPLTIGLYNDDGGNGEPGTKFGESTEITVAGNSVGAWRKITLGTPIRITGANVWIIVGAGAVSNRAAYATDVVAAALRHSADTYGSPPHLSDPCGAMSSDDLQMSLVADYDVAAGAAPPPPGDTTAPVLTAAVTEASGIMIILTYGEPLDATATAPATTDYVVLVDGATRTVSSVAIMGSTVRLTMAAPVGYNTIVDVVYTQGANKVKDLAGNFAASFGTTRVTNLTPLVLPGKRNPGPRTVNPGGRIVGGTRVVGGQGGL
jgi:uncharacterized repeat protein (TIGR02059 family)